MQEAEKSATITETESDGVFGLVIKRRIIELEFAERIAKRLVVVGENWKKSRKDHGLGGFESGKRRRGAAAFDDRVAYASVSDAFDVGDDKTNIAGFQFIERDRFGRERAKLLHFVNVITGAEPNLHVICDAAFHHANEDDGSAICIEPRVKNQRLQRIFCVAGGRGTAVNDGLENGVAA